MFAMRACRKSVMVGMPLNKSQMTTVCHRIVSEDITTYAYTGCATYGDNGPTLELSSWQTYNAAFVGHCEYGARNSEDS